MYLIRLCLLYVLVEDRYIKEIIVDVNSVGYKKNIEVFC